LKVSFARARSALCVTHAVAVARVQSTSWTFVLASRTPVTTDARTVAGVISGVGVGSTELQGMNRSLEEFFEKKKEKEEKRIFLCLFRKKGYARKE